ncbi:MAG: hypothetical protein HY901_22205 [Deltaproteobacteria bacterium]|nr:hypothetical protein [Deltaproteobacteria bacterium]
MFAPGAFVRVTQDAFADEPVIEGMVGKVVPDIYRRTEPGEQALVLLAGARKPCAVPLEALEAISESDWSDEQAQSRELWRMRKDLWRDRQGAVPRRRTGLEEAAVEAVEAEVEASVPRSEGGRTLEVADILRRAEAVDASELAAIASPALVSILTEWSIGALDVLADELPRFKTMSYARARKVRTEHIERWLWDGLRLYLAVRSFHATLPAIAAEPARERVRALFERIDEGEPAERLAAFSLDVSAVKDALSLMATHWIDEAMASFAKGLTESDSAYQELAQYILQLHIVGFQAGFCADQVHHGIPSN